MGISSLSLIILISKSHLARVLEHSKTILFSIASYNSLRQQALGFSKLKNADEIFNAERGALLSRKVSFRRQS